VLRWPDFIEFDEINGKIITKHHSMETFRIWSMATYDLCYVIVQPNVAEFKIW
jgi:hypothetical protein